MKLVHEILQSEKGKEMWSSVAPIYNNDAYNLYIFEAIGTVLDDFTDFIESLDDEVFPQSSTWSLELKEELHGIKPDGRLTREQRIQNLLAEMNKYQTMTVQQLERLINNHVEKRSAKVKELGDYRFAVQLDSSSDRDVPQIIQTIETNKPAHLTYTLENIVKGELFVGTISTAGETISIYPYQVGSITLHGQQKQATASYSQEILHFSTKGE